MLPNYGVVVQCVVPAFGSYRHRLSEDVEVFAVHVNAGRSTVVAVDICRLFVSSHDKLPMVFKAVATCQMSVHMVGDVSIRVDRPKDPLR